MSWMMINHWWFQCRENCSVCWWRWTRPLPSCRFCYYWLCHLFCVIFFVINTTTIIMIILTRRKTLQRYLGLVASVGTRNAFGTSSSTESLPRYFYLYLCWTYFCICAFRLPMLFLGSRWCLWWSPPSACASTPSLPSKSWTTTGISRCWHQFHHNDHDNTKGQPTPGDDRDDLYRLVFSRVCASATWRSQ